MNKQDTGAAAAAGFGADDFRGGMVRAGVKPAGQRFAVGQQTGLARQISEDALRHIFGQMFIAIHLPEGGGIDEIDVAFHQFGEGVLGIRPGKSRKQFGIRCHFGYIL